jgi:hypothetical protein
MAFAPPQNLPPRFRCSNHPEREGIGICVNCRSVVCVECSTRVDRMNYCFRCLRSATADQPSVPARMMITGMMATAAKPEIIAERPKPESRLRPFFMKD